MFELKFLFFVSMVIISSVMLGYNVAVERNCTSNQTIIQCLSKETK